MKLVASMLVKNELGRYLQAAIGSLREFCDVIAVLDDGSTDRTGEWLDDNADERMVVRHTESEGFFAGHEGNRRNALLDFTFEQKPDYVLAIDADEFIADGTKVRRFVEHLHPLGTLVMQEVWEMSPSSLAIRQDGGWREHPVPILWKAPSKPDTRWRIQDRALACGREPMAVRSLRKPQAVGTEILHFGWANPETRMERYQRYREHDDGQFHNRRHLASILWTGNRVQLSSRPWPAGLRLKGEVVFSK